MALVRRVFRTRRVGHAGTLDPFATGLLVVLLGRGTRLARFLSGLPKSYQGTLRLGWATATDDFTGEPLSAPAEAHVSDGDLRRAMAALTGRYPQRPPTFSALKLAGRPAYRRARRGEPVVLQPRDAEVFRFDLVSRQGSEVAFEADVGSGVYIRALARDLGERLGCGGHLRALRRTAVGPFPVTDAASADQVATGAVRPRPLAEAVAHLPSVQVDESGRLAIRQGRSIPIPATAEGPVAVMAGGELVAVGVPAGDHLKPKVVLES